MKTKIIQLLFVFTLVCSVSFAQTADHSLPTTNLPSGGATPVDEKMSTFVTMKLIGNYYSVPTDLNTILVLSIPAVSAAYDVSSLLYYVYNTGPNDFGLTLLELWDVQNTFLTFGSNNVEDAIDNGHPVMVIFGYPSTFEHAVMITGYNNDGTYEYYDPTTGNYDTFDPDTTYAYYGPVGGEVTGVSY